MNNDKPALQLVGLNGNVFVLIGAAKVAARRAGWSMERIAALQKDLFSSGSYDEVLRKLTETFDVS